MLEDVRRLLQSRPALHLISGLLEVAVQPDLACVTTLCCAAPRCALGHVSWLAQPLYASAVLPAERRQDKIILWLGVGLATVSVVLMTGPYWAAHTPLCAARQVQRSSPAPAPAPAPAPSLLPATSTPGGSAGSGFHNWSIEEPSGLCTTPASSTLTFLVAVVANSYLTGPVATGQRLYAALWPAAVGRRRSTPLVWAVLLGVGTLAGQGVTAAVLMRVFHWDLSQGAAAVYATVLCTFVTALADYGLVVGWRPRTCLCGPPAAMAILVIVFWALTRLVAHPWPLWVAQNIAAWVAVWAKAGSGVAAACEVEEASAEVQVRVSSRLCCTRIHNMELAAEPSHLHLGCHCSKLPRCAT